MELDRHTNGDQLSGHNYKSTSDLRVALIGNKDLKYKLVGNINFIEPLVELFNDLISQVISGQARILVFKHGFLEDWKNEAVILKILSSFISEVNTKKNENITTCLRSIKDVITPITNLLSYFVEKFIPLVCSSKDLDISFIPKLEDIIEYSLDILLCISNIENQEIDSEKLSRYITSLLIVTDNAYDKTVSNSTIVTKLLRLVPLLLSNSKSGNSSIIILLTVLLKRLAKVSNIIISTHFPQIGGSPESMHRLAFENENLPNIELNPTIIRSTIDSRLLVELIICTAQIFSYLKENDFDIFMTSSTNSSQRSDNDSAAVILSINIYLTLLMLIKYDDKLLSLASLNLLCFYLNNLKPGGQITEVLIFKNFKKLFARIIEMLNLDTDYKSDEKKNMRIRAPRSSLPMYLLLPTRILADLCSRYPPLGDEIKDSNIDYKLTKQLENYYSCNQLYKTFKVLKRNSKYGTTLVDFTVLLNIVRDDRKLADLFYLLSVYVSSNEEFRSRLINHSTSAKPNVLFAQILFETIDNYHFLLTQMELSYYLLHTKSSSSKVAKEDLPWFGKNLGIIQAFLDSNLYTNCLFLTRSLSRSVATLRTFFVECNSLKSFITKEGTKDNYGGFVTNILEILRAFASSDQIATFFYNLNRNVFLNRGKRIQIMNKSVTIGILANFILDFSSFRNTVINYDCFLLNLSGIYYGGETLEKTNNIKAENEPYEDVYQENVIQLNVLQVIKNYMYNETNENKKELLDYFALATIISNTTYGINSVEVAEDIHLIKMQQKLVAFDILRNITAGSPNFNEMLVQVYEEQVASPTSRLPKTWLEYVTKTILGFSLFTVDVGSFEDDEFLSTMLMKEGYVKLVTSINYIEDHKFTMIESIRKDFFPNDELLKIWLRFLDFQVPPGFESKDLNAKIVLNNNINEIKSSIVWIIVNLTWKYSRYAFNVNYGTDYNSFETVGGPVRRGTTGNASGQRIFIDEGDDSETSTIRINTKENDELSVLDRAKYLSEFGFGQVLTKLINQYSNDGAGPSTSNELETTRIRDEDGMHKNSTNPAESTAGGVRRNLKRFDIQNSHDLLEKLKTANEQITDLLKGGRRVSIGPLVGIGSDVVVSNERPELTIGRPDVNRGGEGFGYESADEEMESAEHAVEEDDDDDDDEDADDPREYWVM